MLYQKITITVINYSKKLKLDYCSANVFLIVNIKFSVSICGMICIVRNVLYSGRLIVSTSVAHTKYVFLTYHIPSRE